MSLCVNDDGHIAVLNMYRIEINIHENELCVELIIYKDYNEMDGQQNVKFCVTFHTWYFPTNWGYKVKCTAV